MKERSWLGQGLAGGVARQGQNRVGGHDQGHGEGTLKRSELHAHAVPDTNPQGQGRNAHATRPVARQESGRELSSHAAVSNGSSAAVWGVCIAGALWCGGSGTLAAGGRPCRALGVAHLVYKRLAKVLRHLLLGVELVQPINRVVDRIWSRGSSELKSVPHADAG